MNIRRTHRTWRGKYRASVQFFAWSYTHFAKNQLKCNIIVNLIFQRVDVDALIIHNNHNNVFLSWKIVFISKFNWADELLNVRRIIHSYERVWLHDQCSVLFENTKYSIQVDVPDWFNQWNMNAPPPSILSPKYWGSIWTLVIELKRFLILVLYIRWMNKFVLRFFPTWLPLFGFWCTTVGRCIRCSFQHHIRTTAKHQTATASTHGTRVEKSIQLHFSATDSAHHLTWTTF